MAILKLLSTCALYQVVGESADNLMGVLASRVSDRSRLIVNTLQESGERAWKTVEISLAGDGFWNRFDAAEDKAFRQQIRNLLDSTGLPLLVGRREFPQLCLQELQQAKKEGLLLSKVTQEELGEAVGPLARQGDPAAILAHERAAIQQMAAVLEKAKYRNLAHLVGQEVQAGQGLLVLAVKYYFRRAVESSGELARSLEFSRVEHLTDAQATGFRKLETILAQHGQKVDQTLDALTAVAVETRDRVKDMQGELTELRKMMAQMMELAQMQQRREVRPGDSCSIRGSREKQRVQELVERYQSLPEEERRQQPEMLHTVAMLQVAAGETQAAQHNFNRLAELADDPRARARARYNCYTVALERRDFSGALDALREAVALDPDAHAPFPSPTMFLSAFWGRAGSASLSSASTPF